MYTSYIGKKFLDIYKKEYQKPDDYTAEQFFDEVMFPLFFDDERHLMNVKGSPFFQIAAIDGQKRKKAKKEGITEAYVSVGKDPEFRKERNKILKDKIYKKELGVHTFVGYGEMSYEALTSGQLTDIDFNLNTEEYYLSWIGQGLAFKSNGLNILTVVEDIMLHIFHGWEKYRETINNTPLLIPNQINTWNSKWLFTLHSHNYKRFLLKESDIVIDKGAAYLSSTEWKDVVFFLSQKYPNNKMTMNIYKIGDRSNESFGFINIFLPEIDEMWQLRDKIFINNEDAELKDSLLEHLQTQYSFKQACEKGVIGVSSLEPRGLRRYMPKGTYSYSQGKELKLNDKLKIEFYLYKLWIIAMIKKPELLELSRQIAKEIKESESKNADRGKTTESKKSKDILDSYSKKNFIQNLELILNKENGDYFREQLLTILELPQDVFPLFITLIKFEYSYLSKK